MSIDALAQSAPKLPVSDIVLNRGEEQHTGNARMVLLSKMIGSRDTAITLDAEEAHGCIQRLTLPSLPSGFYPGSSNETFYRSALLLGKKENPESTEEYYPPSRAVVEEFVGLKYVLLLRTIAVAFPQQIEGNNYSPGTYGGQLMIYDLKSSALVGIVPVIASNQEGRKATGVGHDLGAKVEDLSDAALAAAQGIAAP
ncbi:MAG: hypothetical protein GY811_14655 [Myxococcales bacterium]|nr:hypothetical protein [Myxococcales bacterium]